MVNLESVSGSITTVAPSSRPVCTRNLKILRPGLPPSAAGMMFSPSVYATGTTAPAVGIVASALGTWTRLARYSILVESTPR